MSRHTKNHRFQTVLALDCHYSRLWMYPDPCEPTLVGGAISERGGARNFSAVGALGPRQNNLRNSGHFAAAAYAWKQ